MKCAVNLGIELYHVLVQTYIDRLVLLMDVWHVMMWCGNFLKEKSIPRSCFPFKSTAIETDKRRCTTQGWEGEFSPHSDEDISLILRKQTT